MIAKDRLYINITNKCNVSCDFCCMSSKPSNNTFITFDRFKEIIDNTSNNFELQLEGGEPLLNPSLYLFLEYAKYSNRCKKIIISTNGILLNEHLERLTIFTNFSKIPMVIKRSINYYLRDLDDKIYKKSLDVYLATEFIENFSVEFNVRLRHNDDEDIIKELKKNNIYNHSKIYELQNYGRMNDTTYKKPIIKRNIDNFYIFASDGTCFNENLVERSEYEKKLK